MHEKGMKRLKKNTSRQRWIYTGKQNEKIYLQNIFTPSSEKTKLRKAKKLEELMTKLNISTEEALSMQQTAFLEVSGDETSIKQNNTEISESQEEKASSQTHESSSEPNDSQVDTVEDTTAITKETKVNLTTETEPVCSENETTVTS
ncbi:hypothetical protein OS493_014715 [Desmophyllum pertusum]|uniref:Uncharacterized protein n=1 Tax=Desmophyllum pertusum TaxID=174260 RepID=A0A9W9YDE3_9CNID|nr:hypothetical protein OS493_014715 [Desmophyllum pertusum]